MAWRIAMGLGTVCGVVAIINISAMDRMAGKGPGKSIKAMSVGSGTAVSADCDTKNGTRRQAITPNFIVRGALEQNHSACGLSYSEPPNPDQNDDRMSDKDYLEKHTRGVLTGRRIKVWWNKWPGWILTGIVLVGYMWFEMRRAEKRAKYWRRKNAAR